MAAIAIASFTQSPLAVRPATHVVCAKEAPGSDTSTAAVATIEKRNVRFMLHLTS